MKWMLALVMAVASASLPAAHQAAQRDVFTSAGTASISGIVVDDAQPARPVRRAVVTLTGAGLVPNRGAVTDDEGRFRIGDLPAGRFSLTVFRAAYLTSMYGSTRPGRPGTLIPVAAGDHVNDLRVTLWRGAAIAGVIRDEAGVPIAGIDVVAMPLKTTRGRVTKTLTNAGAVKSDDRGEYRVFGLDAGSYLVAARMPLPRSTGSLAVSDAEVDAMLSNLQNNSTGSTDKKPPEIGAPAKEYASVFYPGVVMPSTAQPVVLGPGQDREGVDISLVKLPMASVDGTAMLSTGPAAAGASVQLEPDLPAGFADDPTAWMLNTTADASGAFHFARVPPGDYTLRARSAGGRETQFVTQGATRVTPPARTPGFVATARMAVQSDAQTMNLTLSPALNIEGQVVFEGASRPLPAPDRLRMALLPAGFDESSRLASTNQMTFVPATPAAADGRFTLIGVMPGQYHFAVPAGAPAGPWWPVSAMLGEADLFDGDADLTSVPDGAALRVTFTDVHNEIAGHIRTADGTPPPHVVVIAFSEDRRYWKPGSRRVRGVRLDVDGRYAVDDLPPGDYFLCAVTDADADDWQDPAFLAALVAASQKFSIAAGEKKVQDLRIGS